MGRQNKPPILIVGPLAPPYGGPENVTEMLLASQLLSKRFEMLHVNTQKPLTNEKTSKLMPVNFMYNGVHAFQMVWKILRYRPQVVFLFLSQNRIGFARDGFFILLAVLLGRRVLASREGGYFHEFYRRSGPFGRWFIHFTMEKVAYVRVESRLIRHQFEGIVPASRVEVCRTGLDPRPFDVACLQHAKKGDKVRVLFMGNISVAKGAVDLVRAAAKICDRLGSKIEFRLVGDFVNIEKNIPWCLDPNNAADKIGLLLRKHDLFDQVQFPGPIYGAEKLREFAEADILVLPSYGEGLANIWIEALIAGLPIITTRVGAAEDVVAEGINGFLIEPGDYKALASRIEELALNPSLRSRMGKSGRTRFEQKFHMDNFAACIAGIFNRLIDLPRILIVGPLAPPYGGPENLMACLVNTDFLIKEFDISHVNTQKPISNEASSQWRLINIGYNLHHAFRMVWKILSCQPNVVLLVLSQNKIGFSRDAFFIMLATLLGRKVIASREGGDFHKFYNQVGPIWRRFIRFTMGKVTCVRVESQLTRRQFDGIIPPSKVKVCRTGMAPGSFDAVCLPNGKTGDRVRVLFIGNISVAKGAVDLVKAAVNVRDRLGGRVEFRLFGDFVNTERNIMWCPDPNNAEEKIRTLMKKHDLFDHVQLPGPIYGAEKLREFAEADIFVLASYSEGLPYGLLEALAAGLPVISTDIGAIPEGVIDGINGFLLKPGDWAGLGRRIAELALDPEARRRMGEASRALLEKKFCVDDFTKCMTKLFRFALD